MKFEKKTLKEIADMSPEEKEAYYTAKEANDAEVRKSELDAATKDIKESQKKSETDIADLSKKLTKIDEAVKVINLPYSETPEISMLKAIAEKHEEIQKLYEAGSGVLEFTMKAPATITTANGTNIDVPAINGTDQAPVTNVNLRRMNIMDYVTTLPTSQSSYP